MELPRPCSRRILVGISLEKIQSPTSLNFLRDNDSILRRSSSNRIRSSKFALFFFNYHRILLRRTVAVDFRNHIGNFRAEILRNSVQLGGSGEPDWSVYTERESGRTFVRQRGNAADGGGGAAAKYWGGFELLGSGMLQKGVSYNHGGYCFRGVCFVDLGGSDMEVL